MIFCKLCEKFGELQESHSVPNAFFSRLFELDSGKAIVTSNDYDDALNYTSDSWATKLLCKKCEGLMNESYDRYGIEVIRGRNLNVQRNEYGVKISKVNIRRFSTFIAAIIWRAAASDHVAYCNVDLNDDWFNRLRRIFLAGDYVSASEVSVRVNRLTCIKYGLSAELMKNLVCNPFFQQEGARRGWRGGLKPEVQHHCLRLSFRFSEY